MPAFHVTFGSQYGDESYGCDPHPRLGYLVHRDGYLTIIAPDEDAARELAVRVLGTAWSNLYTAEDHAADLHYYPRGELLRIVHPDSRDEQGDVELRARIEALIGGPTPPTFLSDRPNKIVRVQQRRNDLGATVTESMVKVSDLVAALRA